MLQLCIYYILLRLSDFLAVKIQQMFQEWTPYSQKQHVLVSVVVANEKLKMQLRGGNV